MQPPRKLRPLHLLPEDQFSRQKLETTWSGLFVFDIVFIVVIVVVVFSVFVGVTISKYFKKEKTFFLF
jgi:hypothetical protein